MSAGFKLEGFEALERNLLLLGPEVGTKAGQKAVTKAAQHCGRAVRAAAPVGDGDGSRTYKTAAGTQKANYGKLKRNIKVQRKRKNRAHTVGSMIGTTNAFWGRFQEFGTRNMKARPWFRPAMAAALPRASEIIRAELKTALFAAAQARSRR